MQYFFRVFLLAVLLPIAVAQAQKAPYTFRAVPLPPELAERENQFSGLFVHRGQLLLLSESRLQDRAEAKVYGLPLGRVDSVLAGKASAVAYHKYPLLGLDKIRARLDSAGQAYEGLEGLTMLGDTAYFTIETTTPSAYCYLIRGRLGASNVTLDPGYLVPLAKPALTDGSHIENAGFEAATGYNKSLLLFFEYNYFRHDNYALRLPSAQRLPDIPQLVPIQRLPFRITDLTYEGRNRFTAINYFFNGKDDQVYRPESGAADARLVLDAAGQYQNYCRLIRLRYRRGKVSWKPLLELPREYMTYNWEGLAAYRGGYFLINDKYGPSKQSTLLYLEKN
ncbi:hypothetical protein [Hymenobacter pini]|uniref:hypothetical protein n=1 Tax=Hymenobacter pini TaxID=2880879 RepID=UPI001CF3B1C2|nr:hypothetical protein [Hymenobacter pini]MCA8829051.1 hypothetical protein [Hymenobacter pini]